MNAQYNKQKNQLATIAIGMTIISWLLAMAMSYEYQVNLYGATVTPVIYFSLIASALWLIYSTSHGLPVIAPRLAITLSLAAMLVGNMDNVTEFDVRFAHVWPIACMVITDEMLLSYLRNKGN